MGAFFLRILESLKGLRGLLVTLLGQSNILGWTIAAAVPIAYVALWITVLDLLYNAISSALTGVAVNVFGGTSWPLGVVYLIEQTMPIQLMFSLSVTLIILRLTAAYLLVTAISAARFLKGR